METTNEKKKFFSINLKWSLGTGLGVVIIFAVFATLLFQSFSSLLIRQEKGHSEEAMNAVTLRLAQSNSTLTDTGVRDILSSSWNDDIQNRKQAAIYSDSVLTATSGKNIGISVYENEKSYRGDQNLNITKGAVPAFSLSIQRLCYVIRNICLITMLILVMSLLTVSEVSVKFPIKIW